MAFRTLPRRSNAVSREAPHDGELSFNECDLNERVDALLRVIRPSPLSESTRQQVYQTVVELIHDAYPNAQTFAFGSYPLKT